jgi:hypothetical protein
MLAGEFSSIPLRYAWCSWCSLRYFRGIATLSKCRWLGDPMSEIPFEAISAVGFVILLGLLLFVWTLGEVWG